MAEEQLYEWHSGSSGAVKAGEAYVISTDRTRLDIDVIHDFLTHSYWVPGIPRDLVQISLEHSLCFGLHSSQAQVGFARVVTDYSRMAHIMDVFVVPAHRGRGLGIWLVQCIVDCPCLQGMGMTLATADAHELYRRFGFTGITATESQMRRPQENPWHRPELIRR